MKSQVNVICKQLCFSIYPEDKEILLSSETNDKIKTYQEIVNSRSYTDFVAHVKRSFSLLLGLKTLGVFLNRPLLKPLTNSLRDDIYVDSGLEYQTQVFPEDVMFLDLKSNSLNQKQQKGQKEQKEQKEQNEQNEQKEHKEQNEQKEQNEHKNNQTNQDQLVIGPKPHWLYLFTYMEGPRSVIIESDWTIHVVSVVAKEKAYLGSIVECYRGVNNLWGRDVLVSAGKNVCDEDFETRTSQWDNLFSVDVDKPKLMEQENDLPIFVQQILPLTLKEAAAQLLAKFSPHRLNPARLNPAPLHGHYLKTFKPESTHLTQSIPENTKNNENHENNKNNENNQNTQNSMHNQIRYMGVAPKRKRRDGDYCSKDIIRTKNNWTKDNFDSLFSTLILVPVAASYRFVDLPKPQNVNSTLVKIENLEIEDRDRDGVGDRKAKIIAEETIYTVVSKIVVVFAYQATNFYNQTIEVACFTKDKKFITQVKITSEEYQRCIDFDKELISLEYDSESSKWKLFKNNRLFFNIGPYLTEEELHKKLCTIDQTKYKNYLRSIV
jgi:hypothetical protein